MMNIYIITGTSRGLGEAMAKKLFAAGNMVFAVSRKQNQTLSDIAIASGALLHYCEYDLADSRQAAAFMNDVFEKIKPGEVRSAALINNAGLLEPIGRLETLDYEGIAQQIAVNLLAPMILSAEFIKRTANWNIPKVILNISSGAAFHPYAGWSVYCATKAGIDMITRVAGKEQQEAEFPVKVFSLAPGIIETRMQEQIRSSNPQGFPERDKFVELYETGQLQKPEEVAGVIAGTLFSNEIADGETLTIEKLREIAAR